MCILISLTNHITTTFWSDHFYIPKQANIWQKRLRQGSIFADFCLFLSHLLTDKRTRLFILPWVPIYSPRPFFLTTLEHELWIYFTFSNFPSKGKACDIFEYYILQDVPTSNTDCQQNTELFNMKPTAVTAPSTQLSGEVSYIFVSYSIGLFTSINLKRQS